MNSLLKLQPHQFILLQLHNNIDSVCIYGELIKINLMQKALTTGTKGGHSANDERQDFVLPLLGKQ